MFVSFVLCLSCISVTLLLYSHVFFEGFSILINPNLMVLSLHSFPCIICLFPSNALVFILPHRRAHLQSDGLTPPSPQPHARKNELTVFPLITKLFSSITIFIATEGCCSRNLLIPVKHVSLSSVFSNPERTWSRGKLTDNLKVKCETAT